MRKGSRRRFAGTDPHGLASQLIWHVIGPDPDLAPWRAALADWAGLTDTRLATKQAVADRLGISNQAVGQRIARITAVGQRIPLRTAQRRALPTLTSTKPDRRQAQRRIAGLFGLTVHTRPAADARRPKQSR